MRDTLEWRVLDKAQNNSLKSIYFEPWGPFPCEAHKALVDALAAYGTSKMVTPPSNIDKFSRAMMKEIDTFRPDLVIYGYVGDQLYLEDIADIHERYPDTFLIYYNADVVWLWPRLFEFAAAFDLTVVSSPSDFPMFAAQGISVGFFPGWTQHQYLQVKRQLVESSPDVVFIGALYPDTSFPNVKDRREAVQAMAASGLTFDLYGPGWERVGLASKGSTFGQYSRNAAIYAATKIGLSVDDVRNKYCCCSDRPYNIAAAGALVLTMTFPGMEWNGWIDGETCVAFDTMDDMIDKARYYASHDDERERIAAAGREMVHKRHVWPARIEALWAMMEGLS